MGKYTDITCCFAGHRDIPVGEETKIMTRVYHRIQPLIQQGVIYYGVGGALGFDRMMTEYLIKLRKENKRLKIIEVLPYEGYRKKWPDEEQAKAALLDKQMDKIVYYSKEPSRGAFLGRDRHLVDGSKYLICYCTRPNSGTALTVKYAIEKGLTVYNASSYDVGQLLNGHQPTNR